MSKVYTKKSDRFLIKVSSACSFCFVFDFSNFLYVVCCCYCFTTQLLDFFVDYFAFGRKNVLCVFSVMVIFFIFKFSKHQVGG